MKVAVVLTVTMKYFILILFAFPFFIGCVDPPDFPVEPQIDFIGMSKDSMQQSVFQEDSIIISISYTDGDGDLGHNDTTRDAFFIDTRSGFLENAFILPFVPEEGAGNGISGEIAFKLYTTCCVYPNNVIPPCVPSSQYPIDTLIFEVYIRDRAGHESNRIFTDPIILLCDN